LFARASTLVCLLLLASTPASAQTGLGDRLDDPTGRTPVAAHPPPPRETPPNYGSQPDGSDEFRNGVPQPPGYGSPDLSVNDAHLTDRLRALDATWSVLGAQGVNYTNSVLSLVLGAAQVVIGGVLLEVGGSFELFAPIFMVTGGVQVARTVVVDFILRPNPQPIGLQYMGMASGTREQQLARLRYGEAQLESLAEQSEVLRYVDSGINIAGAGALVGAYFAVRDSSRDFDPIELIFFIGPGVGAVIAVINLFSLSNAERRWDAYREMRERMGGDLVEITPILQIDPRGGGFAGLQGRF